MTTPNEHTDKIMTAIEAAQRAPESVRDAVVEGLTERCPNARDTWAGWECGLCGAVTGDWPFHPSQHKRIPRDWPDYGLLGALRYLVELALAMYALDTVAETSFEDFVVLTDDGDIPAALDALVDCLGSLEVQDGPAI